MRRGKIHSMLKWWPPPQTLLLKSNEVDVWRASLDLNAARLQSWQQTLSPDERARAGRFHFQKDREHFIVARGLLRAVLASYLGMEPRQLRFYFSPYGKPTLARNSDGNELRFNVSHAGGLALYAITRGRELGVSISNASALIWQMNGLLSSSSRRGKLPLWVHCLHRCSPKHFSPVGPAGRHTSRPEAKGLRLARTNLTCR
jgi:hypothetical protein